MCRSLVQTSDESGIGGRNQDAVRRKFVSSMTAWQDTSPRFDAAQEPLGHRYGCDDSVVHIVEKQILPYRGIRRRHRPLSNLTMGQQRHLSNTDRRRIQAVRLPRQLPDSPPVRLIPITLAQISSVEIQPQVLSCSRIRPLSIVSGPLRIRASRLGIRGLGPVRDGANLSDRDSALFDNKGLARHDLANDLAGPKMKLADGGGLHVSHCNTSLRIRPVSLCISSKRVQLEKHQLCEF